MYLYYILAFEHSEDASLENFKFRIYIPIWLMCERQTDATIRARTVQQKYFAFESENPWKYYPELHSRSSLNGLIFHFYIWVSVHHKSIIYNKPTRCNYGSIVFINNYKYALHVSDALCVHHQEHYKL